MTNLSCSFLLAIFFFTAARALTFEKAIFKVSYVQHGEKIHRHHLSTDDSTLSETAQSDMQVFPTDSISIQASFLHDEKPATPQQVFLRFVNTRTSQDNIYLLRRKTRDMKLDLPLHKQIRTDHQFWIASDTYVVELIFGDARLANSATWTITSAMAFANPTHPSFIPPETSVFDFDISVKKSLLPEFRTPIPPSEARAHPAIVFAAVIAIILPLPALFVAWGRMGVLQSAMACKPTPSMLAFQVCLLAHMAALVMFWARWNIVTTWKVVALLMLPTLPLAKRVLAEGESR